MLYATPGTSFESEQNETPRTLRCSMGATVTQPHFIEQWVWLKRYKMFPLVNTIPSQTVSEKDRGPLDPMKHLQPRGNHVKHMPNGSCFSSNDSPYVCGVKWHCGGLVASSSHTIKVFFFLINCYLARSIPAHVSPSPWYPVGQFPHLNNSMTSSCLQFGEFRILCSGMSSQSTPMKQGCSAHVRGSTGKYSQYKFTTI